MPFGRIKVRLKQEIVTMGVPGTDPNSAGRDLCGARRLERSDCGAGRGGDRHAERLRDGHRHLRRRGRSGDESFRDFPAWWEEPRPVPQQADRDVLHRRHPVREIHGLPEGQGVEEVYHLQGGILKYLEEVPEDQSLWQGGCFVFDERVAVGHGLRELPFSLCRRAGGR
jgi:UPF0176 protein